jgi:glycosyl transferase family 2
MVETLSQVHARFGRSRIGRRLLRALPLHRLARMWMRRSILSHELSRTDDITVLIGVRDRADHRLANALKSLRAQTHPADSIRVAVIDYGSESRWAARTAELCRQHGAEYLRIHDVSVWSRSRCLNIGIRRVRTKFLMTSDVDIVLSPTYLADAVRALTVSPLSIICSPMLDLPEASAASFRRMAETEEALSVGTWREQSSPRHGWDFHPSIVVGYTAFFQIVQGYDEYYEVWGCEDEDLMRRFRSLGLLPRRLDAEGFHLHQWHPKFEGVPDGEHAIGIERNRAYLRRNHSILRNGPSWGLPGRLVVGAEGFEPPASSL